MADQTEACQFLIRTVQPLVEADGDLASQCLHVLETWLGQLRHGQTVDGPWMNRHRLELRAMLAEVAPKTLGYVEQSASTRT